MNIAGPVKEHPLSSGGMLKLTGSGLGYSEVREARGLSKCSLTVETTYEWSKREEKKKKGERKIPGPLGSPN